MKNTNLLLKFSDRLYLLLAVVIPCFFIQGCYSFSQTSFPSYIKTITVVPIKNQSQQTLVGEKIRRSLEDYFKNEVGGVRIVNSNAQADCQTTLKSYSNQPAQFSRSGTVSQYKVTINVDIIIYDKVKNKELYNGKSVQGIGIYDISRGESEVTNGQERALKNLQEMISSNALSNW
jgi:hypothetical protein